ncbi:MAG: (Fe-S)-binding protein [Clostridia bacterium]
MPETRLMKARMQKVMRSNTSPQLRHILDGIDINCYVQKQVEPAKVLHLDEDMAKALEKMKQRDALYQSLPQIDCGSCGAPGCEAFAQDVVQGEANVEDCIFLLRDKVKEMAQETGIYRRSFRRA